MEDLTTVIEDALTDIELPLETQTDDVETPVEAASEPSEATVDPTPDTAPQTEPTEPTEATKPVLDDFEKKFGITAQSSSGRENRIPYSRVKKITDKAIKDAHAEWSKTVTTSHVPVAKYQELETKIKTYDDQLSQVAAFEKVMVNDHGKFLQMLTGIPGYAEILAPLFNKQAQTPQAEAQAPVDPDADMPLPDQTLSDGSQVYSMEGLKALQTWNRVQAKKEAMVELESKLKAYEQRYEPLAKSYESYQQVQAVIPQVQKQIQEARTWPMFNESETEIVEALQKNPNYSLERAYQLVVFPKLHAQRDQMRTEILREVQAAPRSTSVTSGQTRVAPQVRTGPTSIEDVIKNSIKGLK